MATVQKLTTPKWLSVLFGDTRFAWLWLLLRWYIGYEWLVAGYTKLVNSHWVGENAGTAVSGFLQQALQKTSGAHPDVSSAYAWFITNIALPNAAIFSYLVTFGELLVGVALIVGILTTFAALGGAFMNLNYLFAGAVSINPLMLIVQILLVLAWRISGWYGGDYFIYKYLSKSNKHHHR